MRITVNCQNLVIIIIVFVNAMSECVKWSSVWTWTHLVLHVDVDMSECEQLFGAVSEAVLCTDVKRRLVRLYQSIIDTHTQTHIDTQTDRQADRQMIYKASCTDESRIIIQYRSITMSILYSRRAIQTVIYLLTYWRQC